MRKLVFVWENFGPGHADRCEAVANFLGASGQVVGIELFGSSSTYEWNSESRNNFQKITVFKNAVVEDKSTWTRLVQSFRHCFAHRGAVFFLCHYERVATLWLAILLRCCGQRVLVMNDSKFDDYERTLGREIVKFLFYLPYQGGLASGIRSIDYLRFLGIPKSKLSGNYNAISLDRIRRLANSDPKAEPVSFESRHFTIVARLVPKKNLFVALKAYSEYVARVDNPRPLHIAGSGPLEKSLKAHAAELGIEHLVNWHGFVQTDAIARLMRSTLALLLLSTEEQFGNVIIEAHALGIPCIVSVAVGARDHLIRTGVNGFIVEPDNSTGTAYFMKCIASDRSMWEEFSKQAAATAPYGDSSNFASAVLAVSKMQKE